MNNKFCLCIFGNTASIHVIKWAKYFAEKGIIVHCISCSNNTIDGVTLHFLGKNKIWNCLTSFIKIPCIQKKIKPNLVHVHYLGFYSFFSLFVCRIPIIGTAWGSDILILPKKNVFYSLILRLFLKKSKHLIAVSSQLKEELMKYGAPFEKITILPIGVDTGIICQIEKKNIETLKQELRFLVMNPHEPLYNNLLIIKSFCELLNMKIRLSVIFIGSGSETIQYTKIIESYGFSDSFSFKGRINFDDLVFTIQHCDVYVSMAKSAGTPVSLLETMSCGLFPVLSNIQGHKQWVKHDLNGLLVSSFTPECLTLELLKIINSKIDLVKSSEINRKLILKEGDWQKCMETAEKIYKKFVNQ
jgi:glycosyltransferase involved in cell wall biosynthesis